MNYNEVCTWQRMRNRSHSIPELGQKWASQNQEIRCHHKNLADPPLLQEEDSEKVKKNIWKNKQTNKENESSLV